MQLLDWEEAVWRPSGCERERESQSTGEFVGGDGRSTERRLGAILLVRVLLL